MATRLTAAVATTAVMAPAPVRKFLRLFIKIGVLGCCVDQWPGASPPAAGEEAMVRLVGLPIMDALKAASASQNCW